MVEARRQRCERCRREQPPWAMTKCPICSSRICQKCGHFAYGRYFCSTRCAGEFFTGDGDDEDLPHEES